MFSTSSEFKNRLTWKSNRVSSATYHPFSKTPSAFVHHPNRGKSRPSTTFAEVTRLHFGFLFGHPIPHQSGQQVYQITEYYSSIIHAFGSGYRSHLGILSRRSGASNFHYCCTLSEQCRARFFLMLQAVRLNQYDLARTGFFA